MFFSQATILVALATSATAHMIMNYPVPYGVSTLDQAPLAAADFPCKQRTGVYDVTTMNQWNAGETQTVSFLGSAVHGGGSCQFSITTDPKPTLQSEWKVIQSVIGNCPSNVTGNLSPADAKGTGAATFPVKMPSNIPDGQYTFAWTWLNKVGNREFYMNCAPIQVGTGSGSASASSALSSLPDMFVANVPATECSTSENQDFNYPEPGQNVQKGTIGVTLGNDLTGSGCAAMTKLGAGNGKIGSPTQAAASAQASASQPAAKQPAASTPAAYGTPVASSVPSSAGAVYASPAPVVAPSAQYSAPAAAKPTTGSSNNTGSCPTGSTACTSQGAVVCMGSTQFGICDINNCAVAMDVASGMACSNNAIVAATKRSINFPRAHLHRRHGSSRFF